ncbi:hypothetical protein HHL11_11825 [Ramlibacter sp. G-1-2-2]|uniref:DUF1236 domain-containing protein n=1 Tax=Ramlibacter agri TaxID=2728837 RepID=A0A848H7D5_9BURK|nr:hypothetical protein [Ramlibacter agri]NML44443.1 hypothetical protein [Ramlibacter agri]
MPVPSRFPHCAAALLLLAAPFARAESPMPEPIAPAVIGRPLDQIRPARPHRTQPAVAKPVRERDVAVANQAVRTPPPARVAIAVPAPQQMPARALPPAQVMGSSPAIASRSPGPGYFSSKDSALVHRYYEAHPASAQVAQWNIGERIPQRAELTGVPADLRAALPMLPPGHQYVQVDGQVALVAVQSRVVVDAISR